MTDHRANKEFDGPTIPPAALVRSEKPRQNVAELLEQLGWQLVGEGSFNGRRTLVYGVVTPVERQQLPPAEGEYITAVTYDLNPTAFRLEAQVDAVSGVLLQHSRYAADAGGKETLIESFGIQMLQQEK